MISANAFVRLRPSVVATLLALAAALLYWLPEGNPLFIYEREQILNGEVWRLITGHLMHLSPEHFGYDLALFAVTGCWLEYRIGLHYAWMLALTSVAASLYFLLCLPDMAHYGGLSGLASANVVYLCLLEGARSPATRPLWLSILVLFAAKVGYEILYGRAMFVGDTAFEVVPSVHVIGAVVAFSVFFAAERARVTKPE